MTERRLHAPQSLSAKLPLFVLLSFLCGLMTYLVVSWLGTQFVDRFYMSADSVAARKATIYTEFNRYVADNGIRGSDADALERYLNERDSVSILIYSPEELGIAPAERLSVRNSGMQSVDPPKRSGISGRLYPLRFADGVYYISITDNSRMREDAINRGIALVLGVLVIVAVLLWYTNRLTRRIIRLSQEAAGVGAGDLEGIITVDGVDEIAALAADIDGMRDSIIERMGNEKRAWEANSELITAMSHDIRTPMTSLIGYLGLLSNRKSLTEEEQGRYLDAAYGKALALKELTDELFKYFLVFGRSEIELHKEEYEAHLLLMQLLGEAGFDLQDSGMTVQNIDRMEDGYMLSTDVAMLKRVIDNLLSNIKKYADPQRPVVILTEKKDKQVSVTVSNSISSRKSTTESTKIGLRTCEKIMQALGGSFSTVHDEEHFAAEFCLPLK